MTDSPIVPTPAMEAKAQEIAKRYGGGAIPYHAALAAIVETTEAQIAQRASAHNDAILPALKLIVDVGGEIAQWVLLETLALGIGKLHGRDARQTAEFIEAMAQRVATGEREWL